MAMKKRLPKSSGNGPEARRKNLLAVPDEVWIGTDRNKFKVGIVPEAAILGNE